MLPARPLTARLRQPVKLPKRRYQIWIHLRTTPRRSFCNRGIVGGVVCDGDGEILLQHASITIIGLHTDRVTGLRFVVERCSRFQRLPVYREAGVVGAARAADQCVRVRVVRVGVRRRECANHRAGRLIFSNAGVAQSQARRRVVRIIIYTIPITIYIPRSI